MENLNITLKLLKKSEERPVAKKFIEIIEEFIKGRKSILKNDTLDKKDMKILKCIITPPSELNNYDLDSDKMSVKRVTVHDVLSYYDWEIADEKDRIIRLIVNGYIEPLVPMTSAITEISNELKECGFNDNDQEFANMSTCIYKCKYILENFEELELAPSKEGQDVYAFDDVFGGVFQNPNKKEDEEKGQVIILNNFHKMMILLVPVVILIAIILLIIR